MVESGGSTSSARKRKAVDDDHVLVDLTADEAMSSTIKSNIPFTKKPKKTPV